MKYSESTVHRGHHEMAGLHVLVTCIILVVREAPTDDFYSIRCRRVEAQLKAPPQFPQCHIICVFCSRLRFYYTKNVFLEHAKTLVWLSTSRCWERHCSYQHFTQNWFFWAGTPVRLIVSCLSRGMHRVDFTFSSFRWNHHYESDNVHGSVKMFCYMCLYRYEKDRWLALC